MKTAYEVLEQFNPCDQAVDWMVDRTPEVAWNECPNGRWFLWAAVRLGVDHKLLVLAACDCAEAALVFVTAGEERPAKAIETARRLVDGKATKEEMEIAWNAAIDVAWADYGSDCDDAAYAAADVARYAYGNDDDDDAAADAVDAAARAGVPEQRLADIVRARIPWSVIEPLVRAKEAQS